MRWLICLILLFSAVFSTAYANDASRACYLFFEQSQAGYHTAKTVSITNCGDGKVIYEEGKPGHPYYFKREYRDETDFWHKAKGITQDHAGKAIKVEEDFRGTLTDLVHDINSHAGGPIQGVRVFADGARVAFFTIEQTGNHQSRYERTVITSDQAGREISVLMQQFALFCFRGKADEEEKDCRFIKKDDLNEELKKRKQAG